MKKFIVIVLTLALACSLVGCGSNGVTQEEHDALVSEYENLQTSYAELEKECADLQSAYDYTLEEAAKAMADYTLLEAEYNALLAGTSADQEAVQKVLDALKAAGADFSYDEKTATLLQRFVVDDDFNRLIFGLASSSCAEMISGMESLSEVLLTTLPWVRYEVLTLSKDGYMIALYANGEEIFCIG